MRKTRSLGHRVLALFLCCVMVYGLIPTEAVALEPICGIEEHVHDESCHAVYGENVLKCRAGEYLHTHTDECYDSVGNLICYYADFYLHKHSAEQGCYDAGGNLVCTLPEYDESLHEDIYYSGGDVTCTYAPRFGHVHDDSCYETRKTLTCGLEQDENAHRHDEGCYDLILTCGFDDGDASAGETETESGTGTGGAGDAGISGGSDGTSEVESGDAGDVAVLEGDAGSGEGEFVSPEGVLENPDGNAGGVSAEPEGQDGDDYAPLQHVHDESCYTKTLTCGLEETGHVHDDSCYETVRELTCGKIQDDGDSDGVSGNVCRHWQYELHTHDESCFDKDGNVMCGKWELKSHTHDSHCFEREILSYDNPEPTCGKDEHKHGISCYFKEKTEELEAFLDAYEAFMSGIESGEYDGMLSTDEGRLEVAAAAYEVKKLSTALDKDVLKLESVQEMLANLDKYIPEGYGESGFGQDTLVEYTNPWTPPAAKFVSEDVSLGEMSGAKAVFDIELYQFDKSTYDSDAGKAFVTYDVWSASKIAEYNAKYKAAYAQPVTLGSDGGFAFPRLDCPETGVYSYHVNISSFTGADGTTYVPDIREFRLSVEYRYTDSGYLGFIWWDIDTGESSDRLGCAGTKDKPDEYPCLWGSEFCFDVEQMPVLDYMGRLKAKIKGWDPGSLGDDKLEMLFLPRDKGYATSTTVCDAFGNALPLVNVRDWETMSEFVKHTNSYRGYVFEPDIGDDGVILNMPYFICQGNFNCGVLAVRRVSTRGTAYTVRNCPVSCDYDGVKVEHTAYWPRTLDNSADIYSGARKLWEFTIDDVSVPGGGKLYIEPRIDLRAIGTVSDDVSATIDIRPISDADMSTYNYGDGSNQIAVTDYPVVLTKAGETVLPRVWLKNTGRTYFDIVMASCGSNSVRDETVYRCVVDTVDPVTKAELDTPAIWYWPKVRGSLIGEKDDGLIHSPGEGGLMPSLAGTKAPIGYNHVVEAPKFILVPSPEAMPDYSSAVKAKADEIYAGMTVDERIGQMIISHIDDDDSFRSLSFSDYPIGGILLFEKDCYNTESGPTTAEGLKNKIDGYQAQAVLKNGMQLPLLVSVDEEGGLVKRVSQHYAAGGVDKTPTGFVSDKTEYENNNKNLFSIYSTSVDRGRLLSALGFNINYAPDLDVAEKGYMGFNEYGQTDDNHRGRSFSGDPFLVSDYAKYVVTGHTMGGVGSSAKHFPGYGDGDGNTHDGFVMNEHTLWHMSRNDLLPFYSAMSHNMAMVMVTHNSIEALDAGVPSSCSSVIYNYARNVMGYNGILITDDMNMKGVVDKYGSVSAAAIKALQNGADIVMLAKAADIKAVFAAARNGTIPQSRIEDACKRVLCYKIQSGIIDTDIEVNPPSGDEEAVFIDESGSEVIRGSLGSVWDWAMSDGGTVKLLKDVVRIDSLVVGNWDVTLDLNGFELYFKDTGVGFDVQNKGGTFVIKDSSGAVSVSSSELTDFVRQNPKTTAIDGMLFGVWDIDYVNRIAKWQSVDFDSCKPVEMSLDLSRSGGIRMQNGIALLSSADGSFVKFESGYITSDTTSTSRAVRADDEHSMTLDVSDGWIFGYHSTNSIISMGRDSKLVFSGGGVVGSNTPHSAIHVWGYDSRVSLKNAHVSANIALEGAVRVWCENVKLTMEWCDCSSNYGSGVVIDKGGLESMYRCVLAFNRSPDNGGGLVVMDTAWYANVGGSLFAYNSAKENGGAMYIAKGGSIKGYENGAYPAKILNNCADYGGGVCVDRYDVDGGTTKFEQVYFDGNEASTAGSIAVRGHGYLMSFSDILVENGKAGDFPGIRLDIMEESNTDKNIWFNNLTVRNCSLYEPADDKYTMNLRNQGTYTELSGMVNLDAAVTMKPFAENTLYILRNDFNTASRIPVQAGFTVPLMSPVKLAGVPAGSSFDLATAVKCFVPDAAHKVWYDVAQNAIMYGDINYSLGSSSTGEGVQIEYFANIELVNESADGGVYQLQTIDDSNAAVEKAGGSVLRGMKSNKDADGVGGYLPVNARIKPSDGWTSAWPIKQVFLMDNGDDTFSVATHVRLTELYRPRYALVGDGFRLNLGDKATNRFLYTSDGFTTSEVWVKDDRSAFDEFSDVDAYITKSNFDRVVPYSESLYLTSDVAVYEADPENAILVSDTSLVRFVADSDVSTEPIHGVFYDYNITDGTVRTETVTHSNEIFQGQVVNTSRKGINSVANYAGNVTGLFGFGNGNHGSGLTASGVTSKDQWAVSSSNQVFVDGISNQVNQVFVDAEGTTNQINKVNLVTDVSVRPFIGLTFGLVKGLDASGDIVWSDGVHAPKLYNESGSGSTIGRKPYADSTLLFEQNGNVFTLQGVTSSGDGPELSRDLTTFIHPGTHTDMYTNNFWPMDSVDDYAGKDPLEGGDVKYWYQQLKDNTSEKVWSDYPPSDDAVAHNAFFGMHFEVEFDLSDDYVGPMLYYFFGDDDLWVFLDGKLILDIGGVHVSAGQYVDLRDYLPLVDAEDAVGGYTTHKLTVYYNERGSSGSTCWMRFRLPTPLRVTTDTPDDVVTHGNLSIEKQVDGHDGSDVTFPVKLVLRNGDGFFAQELFGEFDYVNSDGSVSGKVKSGDVLNLTPGDVITVRQLPVGTVASVAEDLSGFEHPEFWTLVDDESTVKLAVRFGDDNHLVLKNRYNDKSELRITKRVVDGDNNQMDCNESFPFVGTFRVDGMPLSEPLTGFVCPVGVDPDTSAVGTTIQIRSGDSFSVPANSTVYIKSAPANLEYDIQELPGEAARLGYALVGDPERPSGTISVGNVQEAVFVNALIQDMPELPSAGGIGLRGFMISGSALLCLVLLELRSRKRRTGAAG